MTTFATGYVRSFANKVVTSEVIATGDGSTLTFSGLTASKRPHFLNLSISYTIGGTTYTGTSTTGGVLTGTNISSGTVAEESISVTFSTAPDDTTNITCTYTTKGFIQKLIDTVVGTTTTDSLGSGDGSTKSFSGTLTGLPAYGQAYITCTIGGTVYYIWDRGDGTWNTSPHVDSTDSTLSYTTGAYSFTLFTAPDSGTAISITFTSGSNGSDWYMYKQQNSKNNATPPVDAFSGELLQEIILKNSGESYQDQVMIGFRECYYTGNNAYIINMNGYKRMYPTMVWNQPAYDSDGHGQNAYDGTYKNWTGLPSVYLQENVDLKYWIFSNKSRICGVVRTGNTWYMSFYLGFGRRLCDASKYQFPLLIKGNLAGNSNYTNTGFQCLLDPANPNYNNHTYIVTPTGSWAYWVSLASSWTVRRTDVIFAPTAYNRTNVIEAYLYNNASPYDPYIEYIDVFMAFGDHLTPEDTITIGSDTYHVFNNIYRLEPYNFFAIKE